MEKVTKTTYTQDDVDFMKAKINDFVLHILPPENKTPITQELLKKNGFTYCERDGGCCLYAENDYDDSMMKIILFNVNNEYTNNQLHIEYADNGEQMLHLMAVNYMEHLQNIFKDCGIKKELVKH